MAKAHVYAMGAHASAGDTLHHNNQPYITHLAEIARRVAAIPGATEDMVAAAWLHDVLVRTKCTFTDIHIAFGIDIAGLVLGVSNMFSEVVTKGVEDAPPEAHTIFCARMITDIQMIAAYDPQLGEVWFPFIARDALNALTKADPGILEEAHRTLDDAIAHVDSVNNSGV